ncbi:histidine ammonia-lyase [Spelaeicoccus albus]|uniref:Histidine ammonia-lyase n=1 Tax=Spelaeicoccus albus TaxID=1280376 RepID=A0A7Z0IJ12_9MICO|nr:histidine ammonia-lyase [Spelaeicoccus albus]
MSEGDLVKVARHGQPVELADDAKKAIADARGTIDKLAAGDTPVYGVSTGFGALATTHIPTEKRAELQRRLIRSHAAGSGAEVESEVVRALMLLRLSTLATGHTGIKLATAEAYAKLLSSQVTPVVYEYGSLGCSGDLAPLAHCALALIGEGQARKVDGTLLEGKAVLEAAGIDQIELAEKEGLALINGTDGMLGTLVLAMADLDELLKEADIAAAMTTEALLGTDRPFDENMINLRPQPGQALSAKNLRAVLKGSSIIESARGPQTYRVQDAYSIRCHPQVAGAVRNTLAHAREIAGYELASAIDNPVIAEGEVESNGNFHGAPVAYVLDFLAIGIADLASICERRTDRLLDKSRSHGLPPFLTYDAGVDSGGMITQYTSAGIVSELKRLAVPSSVDSIPSSAMQEDHVSMGWSGARKLRRSIDGLRRVIAIEILNAAKALDIRTGDEHRTPGPVTAAVVAELRKKVDGPGPDRFAHPEIAETVAALEEGRLVAAAKKAGAALV